VSRPPPHEVAIPHLLEGKQRTKTLVWIDETSSLASSDSTSTSRKLASGNSCKNLMVIKGSDQKLRPLRNGTLVWSDETSASPSIDSTSTPRKLASGNSCKNLMTIKGSDQKLRPLRNGTLVWSDKPAPHRKAIPHLVWSDETSASPSSDSTSTARKIASGNSSIILKVMQWSDQKLGPFRTGTLVWSGETFASPSSDSKFTPRKPASGNSCKHLMAIKWLDQKL
jgi:hypothetical protein